MRHPRGRRSPGCRIPATGPSCLPAPWSRCRTLCQAHRSPRDPAPTLIRLSPPRGGAVVHFPFFCPLPVFENRWRVSLLLVLRAGPAHNIPPLRISSPEGSKWEISASVPRFNVRTRRWDNVGYNTVHPPSADHYPPKTTLGTQDRVCCTSRTVCSRVRQISADLGSHRHFPHSTRRWPKWGPRA